MKYVRLVRRRLNGRVYFYAQLVCEGHPYQKPRNYVSQGIVGLDLGPSTIAGVSDVAPDGEAFLYQFCAELEDHAPAVRRLQRQLERQRRANNPDNYQPDGTLKVGIKVWKASQNYRHTQTRLAELYRKQAAYRQSLQGRLVNQILRSGNDIRLEKISYKAWQRRFGRSIQRRAPGQFVEQLKRKAVSAGATVTELPAQRLKLSQTCHGCGQQVKKPLSQRWHNCGCGVVAQRDLYAAFLAACVDQKSGRLDTDLAQSAWSGVDTLFQAVLSRIQTANGGRLPASFGLRSQSRSPEQPGRNVTEGADAVPPSAEGLGEPHKGDATSGTPAL